MRASIVPAPWQLQGDSVIQILLNPVEEVRDLVPPRYKIQSLGGFTIGALMWVHYTYSPVGLYEEFIFIPARVRVKGRTGYHMSHIWVDSQTSMESGRANWWIPKRLGTMTYRIERGNVETALSEGNTKLVTMQFKQLALIPPVPMHTLTFPMPLIQEKEDSDLYVPYGGWGWVRPLAGSFCIENKDLVPVPDNSRRLPAMWLGRFRMRFSVGKGL